MKIPQAMVLSELQAMARDIYATIDAQKNLQGDRITGAGEAIEPFDYVRKFDMDRAIASLRDELGLSPSQSRTALVQDVLGDFLISGNYKFKSNTANIVTLDHAASAARTFTLPDADATAVYDVTALTSSNIIIGAGTSKVAPLGALGTTVTVLHGNAAGAPTFGAVDLTADVTGTLPVGNGGTGVTLPASVYTPTLTSVANVAAKTAYQCQYMRVGSVVIVSGKVDVDPTLAAPTYTEVGISLPIASNIGAAEDLGGTGSSLAATGTNQSALIGGDVANDRAAFAFEATDAGNQSFFFIFMYRVI